jgi:hypothetical protein
LLPKFEGNPAASILQDRILLRIGVTRFEIRSEG